MNSGQGEICQSGRIVEGYMEQYGVSGREHFFSIIRCKQGI